LLLKEVVKAMTRLDIKNILLVDDNRRFLTALAELLQINDDSLSILTAENGKSALKILESFSVDVVMTDLHMPEMDGFELINHMKKTYPAISIIVMSASFYPELETRLGNLGITHYIPKESLSFDAIEEMLMRSRRREEVMEPKMGSFFQMQKR
jgi:YesN/AraC family two-component response regulator